MQQGSKRLISMIITLFSLVGAFIIFFQLIRPAYIEAQDTRAEVIARQAFIDAQQEAVAEVQKLIEQFRSNGGAAQTVNEVLPDAPDVGGALYQLTSLARNNDVFIKSTTAQSPQISVSDNNKKNAANVGIVRPLGVASFQVKAEARYEDIRSFLEKLEDNVRLMDVQSLALSEGNGGLLDVDLTVATYYQLTQ